MMMICDGVHLSDDVARLVLRICANRVVPVSDSVSGTGRGPGRFQLGEAIVYLSAGDAKRGDGTLAGGVKNLAAAIQHAVRLVATPENSIAAVTSKPARLLGRDDLGVLRLNHESDVVILDEDLLVQDVLLAST